MDANTFKNEWLGKHIDYDHVYAYQCVDLILEYVKENYGLATGVWGNAIDYWNRPSPVLLTKFDKVSTTDCHLNDIVIFNGLAGNPLGHIGICISEDGGTVTVLEQNGQDGSGSGTGGNAIRTRAIAKSRIAGVLRPKSAAAPTNNAPPAGSTVHLPANEPSWRLYRVGSGLRPNTTDQIAVLAPSQYGGLTYGIVAHVGDYAVVIDTQMFGRGTIWIKGTDAQIS